MFPKLVKDSHILDNIVLLFFIFSFLQSPEAIMFSQTFSVKQKSLILMYSYSTIFHLLIGDTFLHLTFTVLHFTFSYT